MGNWNSWGRDGGGASRFAAMAIGAFVAAGGAMLSMPAEAQIASTKHNLGTSGTGANKFSGTAEICVFCHTPHGADTTAAVPLWNRSLGGATYTTYDSLGTSTLDGKTAPVGSVSIACLSCHDGTQSMSTVINAPGSGLGGDSAWQTGTWGTSANQTGGKISAGLITNIGEDLRNDHPIGIQYGGGGYKDSTPALALGATRDPDFKVASNSGSGTSRVWWVDTTGGTTNRDKTDMVLYTRNYAGGAGEPEPFVECASCHDPHTNTATFLRIANTGSAVCLACHIK